LKTCKSVSDRGLGISVLKMKFNGVLATESGVLVAVSFSGVLLFVTYIVCFIITH
jgi:ABC-type cobalamin transport system permease subunit